MPTLRAITHEVDRAYKRLDADDNDADDNDADDNDADDNEELALYIQDLRMARTIMAQEYEARRLADDDGLTAVEPLLKYFSDEELIPK